MTPPDSLLAGAPGGEDGPVFEEPWQAQAFALAVQLNQEGAFTWAEWAKALSAELSAGAGLDGGSGYYACWLTALETLVAAKGLTDPAALATRKARWAQVYRVTPHGRPVELSAGSDGDRSSAIQIRN